MRILEQYNEELKEQINTLLEDIKTYKSLPVIVDEYCRRVKDRLDIIFQNINIMRG